MLVFPGLSTSILFLSTYEKKPFSITSVNPANRFWHGGGVVVVVHCWLILRKREKERKRKRDRGH